MNVACAASTHDISLAVGGFFWEKTETNSEMASNVKTSLRLHQYSICFDGIC